MATKSNVAKVEDVKSGVTLYKVYSLGAASFIDKVLCLSKPYQHATGLGLFAKEKGNGYVTDFSLRDAGIIANCYNSHKTFTTLKAAQRYVSVVNKGENLHSTATAYDFYDHYAYEDYFYDTTED